MPATHPSTSDTQSPQAAAAHARQGLSSAQATSRLQRDGPNTLTRRRRRGAWTALLLLLREPTVLLLLAASVLYWVLGDPIEAAVLAFSVVAVIGMSFYQEGKSEHALEALRELGSPRARTIRDGQQHLLPARELVIDDLILLAAGDRVPADAQLIESADVALDESLLSGESVPVRHSASEEDAALVQAGTLMVRGHALARVVATGSRTAIGRIGISLAGVARERSPLQREMSKVVMRFGALALVSCLVVVVLFGVQHGDWLQALLAGITLAISNIPEEFPVVLSVFLALGAARLARKKALVRTVPAVEALGSITVLCVDKTGTLTENRMRVEQLVPAPAADDGNPEEQLLQHACLASDDQPYDPMDRALHVKQTGMPVARSIDGWARVREYPLEATRPFTAHAWRTPANADLLLACKGAPESVAAACQLAPAELKLMEQNTADMAAAGLRVLGVARARWPDTSDQPLPEDPRDMHWQWLGLVGFADPLRDGVPAAIAEARTAGVRVIMLTGDHVETAKAVAAAAGLEGSSDVVLGADIDSMDDAALEHCVASSSVFARVRPEHKLRLVRALRAQHEVVAMTGDGVNDAPALMQADVGIAMGERGTDVAREAASVVLLDDNFVSVIGAIREGRRIYDNLVHAVRYVLAVHVPITGLALLPLLLGAPMVLLPIHVVFLELIIDPACAIAFEREPAAADIMRRPPRDPRGHLLNFRALIAGLGLGLAAALGTTMVYLLATAMGLQTAQIASLSFTSLVTGNLALIFANRARFGQVGARNPAMWTVVVMALAALAAALLWPPARQWFHFTSASALHVAGAILLPIAVIALVEAVFFAYLRWRSRRCAPLAG